MLGFRVWDSESKDMFYPDDSGDSYYINMKGRAWVDLDGDLYSPRDSCELIPMQSTGLIDEDERPIYEGDIIGWQDGSYLELVENVTSFVGRMGKACEIQPDGEMILFYVIGNRWENPELLEKINAGI